MKKTHLFLTALITLLLACTGANAQTIYNNTERSTCSGVDSLSTMTTGYTSGQTLRTYYGDGSWDVNPVTAFGGGYGIVWFAHYYATTGTYTVKEVLVSGGVDVDSVTFSAYYIICQTMTVRVYNDVNSNCTYDAGDVPVYEAASIEVDSAGVPVDTISTTSYGDYVAHGPMGT